MVASGNCKSVVVFKQFSCQGSSIKWSRNQSDAPIVNLCTSNLSINGLCAKPFRKRSLRLTFKLINIPHSTKTTANVIIYTIAEMNRKCFYFFWVDFLNSDILFLFTLFYRCLLDRLKSHSTRLCLKLLFWKYEWFLSSMRILGVFTKKVELLYWKMRNYSWQIRYELL